jgi:hypothetical protein
LALVQARFESKDIEESPVYNPATPLTGDYLEKISRHLGGFHPNH